MKIKSAHILIFTGIILIFIVVYFVFQSLNKENNPMLKILNTNSINPGASINDAQSEDASQTGEADPDAVIFNEASTAGDRSICGQLNNDSSKLLCDAYVANAKARSEKNIKLCEEITNESYRADCHDNMIVFFVKQEKNKEKCGELIDRKRMDECQSAAE